ncbi:probable receptor-like protein kinase At1g11050 [Aristolochia californica]|uniref:probable receptor-like protein kinase At1g11050 n=1 Tax=Aristolochia californica TaxID=171875 RepID=UPI0035E311B0
MFFLLYLVVAVAARVSESSMLRPEGKNNTESVSSCPLDFGYIQRLPWESSPCKSFNKSIQNEEGKVCCQTLLSLFGISLAFHLKETSFFHLPDRPTSAACISDFQSHLISLSLPSGLASACLSPPDRFVISPTICAGIQTKQDWLSKLGPTTVLDSSCKSNLSDLTLCNACVTAGVKVSSRLTSLDGDSSHATDCFYFTILYAAGVVNDVGPESPGTASCIMGLALHAAPPAGTSKSHSPLFFASIGAGAGMFFMLGFLGTYFWWQRQRKKKNKNRNTELVFSETEGQSSRPRLRPNTGSIWFSMEELEGATDGFSQRNLIGRGGYGIVYKGILPDGTLVAVKKLIESDFQGDAEFCNEVEIISNLKHRNLVPLRGCCMTEADEERGEKQRYLVYDYMLNGNLDDYIFSNRSIKHKPLNWHERKSIILDVAKGLAYLHYGVKPAIYHRDIKATNILLDVDLKARVSDFGLAKESRDGESHLTTRVAGTHGYLAPEYALYGQLTEKSDVYSFGVVILEIMSGRKALDLSSSASPRSFLITDWAWSLVKTGRIEEVLADELVSGDANPRAIMERFVLVGVLCAHIMVALRPTILDAIKMLEGDIDVPPLLDRPLPYCSRAIHSEGNTSTVSPVLSGPLLQEGEMLR